MSIILQKLRFPIDFVLLLIIALPHLPAKSQQLDTRISDAKITILSTMLVSTRDGVGEWGFSALVEADGHKVLVDTGGSTDAVLKNAQTLNIDLSDVEDVILTHNHSDHTSGLLTLRKAMMRKNPAALSKVYVASGIFWPRPKKVGIEGNSMIDTKRVYEETGGKIIEISDWREIFSNVWLSGPVTRKFPEKNWSSLGKVLSPTGLVEDTIPEDQSLVLNTTKGLVVVTGCAHAGIVNILTDATEKFSGVPVKAIVGGLHLYRQTDAQLDWTSDKLRSFQVQNLLGAHCTGIEAVYHLRSSLGLSRSAVVVGSVGAVYSLKDGIIPGEVER